jgi:7,8-dihydropterin-6-yl-methyl-4-(beta-D-ribofuranosyl)aminobenzene 5'-phosphate synthase
MEVTMSRQGTSLGKADLSVSGRKIGAISRREALCAGASTVLWTMIAGLLGRAKPARAQALGGQVPTVDRLAVRVVTDSYYLAFAQNQTVGGMEVQRFRLPPSDQPPGRALLSEFGLAWHVESTRGAETRHLLLDFGFTSDTLNNNLDLYGIAPEKLDAMMLTHGHYDHFGGMVGFLAQHKAKLKAGIPFYVGGEEAFCTRQSLVGPQPSNFGALDRYAIEDAKVKVLFADQPSLVADHGFATGPLPTVSFERIFAQTQMRAGVQGNFGCYLERIAEDKRNKATADYIPDDFAHEIALVFNVRNRGLVVLSSCSHRGVVNAVKRALTVSGVNKVHAVLGGFHLAPHKEDYVRDTVLALKELDPDAVVPMHCTGEAFMEIAAREMPGKVVRSYTGTCYAFGA